MNANKLMALVSAICTAAAVPTYAANPTLDISGREGTWPVESLTSGCSLSFAANATVTVAVGERATVPNRLVSWTTAPEGADTLKVLCDRSDIKLEVRDDGIYRKRGLMIVIR